MTFLEKFKQDHTNASLNNYNYPNCCPCDLGYEMLYELCGGGDCLGCWNREMPKLKTRLEALLEVFPKTKMVDGIPACCTALFGLEECGYSKCGIGFEICRDCWNKEIDNDRNNQNESC